LFEPAAVVGPLGPPTLYAYALALALALAMHLLVRFNQLSPSFFGLLFPFFSLPGEFQDQGDIFKN
jgi:hypothetical protein